MKPTKQQFRQHTKREMIESYLFVTPLIFFISLFVLIPVVGTLLNSLFVDVSFMPKSFVFLDNFKALIDDPRFWQSVRFTVLFALVAVPVELIIGMVLAVLLNESIPLRGLMRAIVLIPWVIPAAISARTWEMIYNYSYGLANYLGDKIGIIDQPVNWLGTTWGAFVSLIVADAWKMSPFVAIILLAGLSAIPDDLYKQAHVDGAGLWFRFRKITIPMLAPVIMVAVLFRSIDALRVFDLIFVLTGGGPGGSTTSLSHYGYTYFISGDFGYASTISVVLFIITFSLSMIYIKIGMAGRQL